MKSGANVLNEFVEFKIAEALSSTMGPYRAEVIDTSPLTIQPLELTVEGKKQVPIRGVKQLVLGSGMSLSKGDEVLVIVPSRSGTSSEKNKFFIADPNRNYSIDSSIVIGVIR